MPGETAEILVQTKTRYRARFAASAGDIEAAQALRRVTFSKTGSGRDIDVFDDMFRHTLIENAETGALVATYRWCVFESVEAARAGYTAQSYDLAPLRAFAEPVLEMGRFCVAPGAMDPNIQRIAWGVLARIVDQARIGMIFGCTSFLGNDPRVYEHAFAHLRAHHLGPQVMRPGIKARETVAFPVAPPETKDRLVALKQLPPLLRSYLGMGGWVGDHAVIDRALHTLHVFTALETARIPPNRARALRHIAKETAATLTP